MLEVFFSRGARETRLMLRLGGVGLRSLIGMMLGRYISQAEQPHILDLPLTRCTTSNGPMYRRTEQMAPERIG